MRMTFRAEGDDVFVIIVVIIMKMMSPSCVTSIISSGNAADERTHIWCHGRCGERKKEKNLKQQISFRVHPFTYNSCVMSSRLLLYFLLYDISFDE
jgi:hypothetical protein